MVPLDRPEDGDRVQRSTHGHPASETGGATDRASTFIRVLEGLAGHVAPGSRILDFGCGNGNMVHGLCRLGYDAFGCDVEFKDGPYVPELTGPGRLRLTGQHPYSLPFDDCSFDVVVSDQVFEHVVDYDSVLREIRRVLRKNGTSLHVFPSRYAPIEPHVYVPCATIVRAWWWLLLWARLGIRNEFQEGDLYVLVAAKNRDYLRDCTNYLTRRDIQAAFARYFPVVRFAEREYLLRAEPGGRLRQQIGGLPLLPNVYSELRSRVVYATKATAIPWRGAQCRCDVGACGGPTRSSQCMRSSSR